MKGSTTPENLLEAISRADTFAAQLHLERRLFEFGERVVPAAIAALGHPHARVRQSALAMLRLFPQQRGIDPVAKLLDDPNATVVVEARYTLNFLLLRHGKGKLSPGERVELATATLRQAVENFCTSRRPSSDFEKTMLAKEIGLIPLNLTEVPSVRVPVADLDGSVSQSCRRLEAFEFKVIPEPVKSSGKGLQIEGPAIYFHPIHRFGNWARVAWQTVPEHPENNTIVRKALFRKEGAHWKLVAYPVAGDGRRSRPDQVRGPQSNLLPVRARRFGEIGPTDTEQVEDAFEQVRLNWYIGKRQGRAVDFSWSSWKHQGWTINGLSPAFIPQLGVRMHDKDPGVRIAAVLALARYCPSELGTLDSKELKSRAAQICEEHDRIDADCPRMRWRRPKPPMPEQEIRKLLESRTRRSCGTGDPVSMFTHSRHHPRTVSTLGRLYKASKDAEFRLRVLAVLANQEDAGLLGLWKSVLARAGNDPEHLPAYSGLAALQTAKAHQILQKAISDPDTPPKVLMRIVLAVKERARMDRCYHNAKLVAPLLDHPNVEIRRQAYSATFELSRRQPAATLVLAALRDEDPGVIASGLGQSAFVRTGDHLPLVFAATNHADRTVIQAADLALVHYLDRHLSDKHAILHKFIHAKKNAEWRSENTPRASIRFGRLADRHGYFEEAKAAFAAALKGAELDSEYERRFPGTRLDALLLLYGLSWQTGDLETARQAAREIEGFSGTRMNASLGEIGMPNQQPMDLKELVPKMVENLDQPIRIEIEPDRFRLGWREETTASVTIVNRTDRLLKIRARDQNRAGALGMPHRTFREVCTECGLSVAYQEAENLRTEFRSIGPGGRLTLPAEVRAGSRFGTFKIMVWSGLEAVYEDGSSWYGWVPSNLGVVEVHDDED